MHIKSTMTSTIRKEAQNLVQSQCVKKTARALKVAKASLVETTYPTRCVICDAPSSLLCEKCLHLLPYVDINWSCKKCGGLWGYYECTECNPLTLSKLGLENLPYDDFISALHSSAISRRIVSAYKDQGERRLASVIANIMSFYISAEVAQNIDAITYIPARREATRRRGYDHMQLVAHSLSQILGIRVSTTLSRPRGLDQRGLSRLERIKNTHDLFSTHVQACVSGAKLLLIDDVATTGSTIISAASALKRSGASVVYVRTFARG